MNDEEKNQLLEIANSLYENIKPIINFIYEIGEVIDNIIIELFECIKEILTTKVSIRKKKIKKGNKYINKYQKVEMWRLLL